jgi:hypothetical protein
VCVCVWVGVCVCARARDYATENLAVLADVEVVHCAVDAHDNDSGYLDNATVKARAGRRR